MTTGRRRNSLAVRTDYVKAGMKPSKPFPNRPTTMHYYAVPAEVLEGAIDLARWARKSIAVAGAT